MRRSYFLHLIIILLLAGAGAIYAAQQFRLAWRTAIVSQVQSQLLFIKLIDAEFPARSRSASVKNDATLLFVGDVMLARGVAYQINKNQDPAFPFLMVADILRTADLAFGNLEGPMSDRGVNQGSEYSFRAEPKAVAGLVFAGFDIVSLANNHILDWGADALSDTLDILKKNNIETVGAGMNKKEASASVIRSINGARIAFFAYTDLLPRGLWAAEAGAGVSAFDLEKILGDIADVKTSGTADIAVVSLHWGEEYKTAPSDAQRMVARALIDAGADLVVGHHPHVAQEVERYKNGWIAYSLGNFVFDQDAPGTREGAMLRVTIQRKNIARVSSEKILISGVFQPAIAP